MFYDCVISKETQLLTQIYTYTHRNTKSSYATFYLIFFLPLLHFITDTNFFFRFFFVSLPSPYVSLTHCVYLLCHHHFLCSHTQPPIPPCLCNLLSLSLSLSLSGLSPAQSEFNYLNTARTLELYGVELHYARVSEVLFYVCSSVLVLVCVS